MSALSCPSFSLSVSALYFGEQIFFLPVAFEDMLKNIFSPPGRSWPVSFGSGLGVGMGCANCQYDFKLSSLIHGRMVKVSTAAGICLFESQTQQQRM